MILVATICNKNKLKDMGWRSCWLFFSKCHKIYYINHAQLVVENHMAFSFSYALMTLAQGKCYSCSLAWSGPFCLHKERIQG